MNDLEERLSAALAAQAAELPPSAQPRMDLEFRLARRAAARARRPLLAAAASVVLVAAVAVPVMSTTDQVAVPAEALTAENRVPMNPQLNDPYNGLLIAPVSLGEFTDGGVTWSVSAFVRRDLNAGEWTDRLCVVATRADQPRATADQHRDSGCEPVPEWPVGPTVSLVETREVFPGGGSLPGVLLFLTAPEIRTLEVRRGDGAPADVREAGRTDQAALFVGDFGGSAEGFGYTARDAAGAVLEEGIS